MNRELKRFLVAPTIFTRLYQKIFFSVCALLLICACLPWSIFSSGTGRVTAVDPNERIQDITAPVSGFIKTWLVKEGSQVRKGQPIVELVDNDPNLLDRITREKEASAEAVTSSRLALDTAKINMDRQQKLFEEGLTSRKEYEKAKIEVSKFSVELSKAVSALARAETQVSRQTTQRVEAPRDGRVLRILAGEGNRLIKSGEPLIVFAPDLTTIAVEIWVDGIDIPYLKVGQNSRVEFEGWPSIQIPGWPSLAIGTFRGKVQLVDYASSYQGKFRALIIPDGKWPSNDILKLNANARGVIALRDTHVGVEVWRKFNNFPPLSAPIQDELNKLLSAKKADSESSEPKQDKSI